MCIPQCPFHSDVAWELPFSLPIKSKQSAHRRKKRRSVFASFLSPKTTAAWPTTANDPSRTNEPYVMYQRSDFKTLDRDRGVHKNTFQLTMSIFFIFILFCCSVLSVGAVALRVYRRYSAIMYVHWLTYRCPHAAPKKTRDQKRITEIKKEKSGAFERALHD